MPADNPFFETSALPYQLPPFDVIDDSHYLPAFERGFAEQLAEIDEITGSDEPATFANTVAAFEKSGLLLTRVANTFFALHSSDATPEMEAIDEEVTPRFAAHRDAIRMNRALYRRLTAIDADAENLDAESRRLLDKMRKDFVRSGAELDDAQQDELRAMNTELASLTSEFGRKLLADTNDSALVVDDPAELDGLSADAVSAAAHAADELGRSGSYALPLVLPTVQPDLAVLTNPETRRALFDASIVRGARANENDTRKLVSRITSLRSRRAKLLGYQTHADLQIEDQTAGTPEAAGAMLSELAPPAVANGRRELAQLAEQSDSDTAVDPWDVHFLSEEFRRERLSIDTAAFRPYFELDRVLFDGVFYAANRLYGITFDERTDLPTYHDGVRTFEVHDADGSELGLFLGDYFTRPTKRGGAWMTSFVDQSTLLGQKPVVVNNLNIPEPADGETTLLTLDQVRTMFHEFGHALHGLFSNVTFPSLSGTNVPRDFVEYPSQVNEMWMVWPEVITNYARHYETDEPMPVEWIDKIVEARRFGQGYATTEYLAAAMLDLVWHSLEDGESIDDPITFEAQALDAAGLHVPAIPPRYRSCYFNHIFAGGYSAGYYSYIWSEVLDADTVEWFKENGGLGRVGGDYFRETLLSRGGSVDPMDAFRNFRGRDPQIAPLLRRRGLNRD
ncbi:M3 family metallopeptidase [Spelaeicoccus albus]|uniref:Peptidyl-dipeptidase Dcp n=1 Tax=Spelaeicoccus albus TaxID=1280376 RepID=A0A7Z0A7B8_9MICO|nr:M3 family metallopeptidase [Spelaeicoccus albus]NYI65759.1 peptidyl-dipeptidase Dcp [Spelaeicoccus albus]